jgi:sulfate adenylyltransferase
MHDSIPPHGGTLINRVAEGARRTELGEKAKKLPQIVLDEREQSDLDMIACGALSPLTGFMGKEDYLSVVETMRLKNGLPWTIPITLSVSEAEAKKHQEGSAIALSDGKNILAILNLKEKYSFDKEKEASLVYKTTEEAHPGVAALYQKGDWNLAGEVEVLRRVEYADFREYRLDPAQLRKTFHDKGWKRIVAFQTRNPIHRAHEYLQKCALEIVDGLLVHPLVGATKSDDIPADVRMRSYEAILEQYYPKTRTLVAVNPAAMRYAGPREAIFHALIRKNYGCTHFIVGRDHAGVGNYYGTFDAHYIFDEFEDQEIGITPMFFDHSFYCKKCDGMASYKTCPHDKSEHVTLSGTKVREMLQKGEMPPKEFSRPEVVKILIDAMRK